MLSLLKKGLISAISPFLLHRCNLQKLHPPPTLSKVVLSAQYFLRLNFFLIFVYIYIFSIRTICNIMQLSQTNVCFLKGVFYLKDFIIDFVRNLDNEEDFETLRAIYFFIKKLV